MTVLRIQAVGNVHASRHRRLRRSLAAAFATIMLIFLASFFLPLPYSPTAVDTSQILRGPSLHHLFGTDQLGEDIFSMVIRAGRTDLPLALAGTAVSLVTGVSIGLLVSYFRRWGDKLMRFLDAFQALPLLIVILSLVALSGQRLYMVIVAIAIYGAPVYIRIVRSEVLTLRKRRFVEAAIACGASPLRVMYRHLLPNIRHIVLAQTALVAATALLSVSVLSYLGIGIRPPTPSWGAMIAEGQQNLVLGAWWTVLFPGLAIATCVLCFNLLADSYDQLRRER